MSTNLKAQTFNITTATLADFNALNQHNNRIRSERLPDDPPISLDEFI